MGFLIKVFIGLLTIFGGIMGGLAVLAFLSLEPEPEITGWQQAKPSLEQAEQWIAHIQSNLDADQLNRLEVDAGDIQSLVYYWANRLNRGKKRFLQVYGAQTRFMDQRLVVEVSLSPALFPRKYINLRLVFADNGGEPVWEYLEAGYATLPGSLLKWVLYKQVLPLLPPKRARLWRTVTRSVRSIDILSDRAVLVYRSTQELREQIKSQAAELVLGDAEEKAAIELYLSVLSAAAAQHNVNELQLSSLLRTMVALAKSRSEKGSAVEENRRLLRAFAIQVSDASIRSLLAPGIKSQPIERPIVLRGRLDLCQHFLVSAALALTLDEETALDIGVSKEQADSKAGGSGFSFSDLVADMAGIRFASALTASEEQARWAQDYLLAHSGEQVFMPLVDWVPRGLTAAAYRDLVRHPLYPAMLDKIVTRLNALPILSWPDRQ